MDEQIKLDGQNQNQSQQQFRPYRSPSASNETSTQKPKREISRKDIFLMSFFGFLFGGILIAIIALVVGSVTGYITLDILPGEEEVAEEIPVIENTTIVPEVVAEPVVEEVVEEEPSDPCNEDISLLLDDPYKWNDRTIILTLAGDSAARISVGGKSSTIDVGRTIEINRMDVYLVDSSESSSSATIQVVC